jgi:hypothetical protein
MESAIRIFISYSGEDQSLVDKLVEILKDNGITVLWRQKLRTGNKFDEELKVYIEHAHVFMPVLTGSSSYRGWVHQEIGYAIGLHIPVFPVTTEEIQPDQMLKQFQATKLSTDLEILKKQLEVKEFRDLIDIKTMSAKYERAARVGERARMLVSYSNKVCLMKEYGLVRQKGGLSSFHIPEEWIGHQDWTDRYYPKSKSDDHKELQRAERLALQKHVDHAGCRLIINPAYAINGRDNLAAITRINTLISFLNRKSSSEIIVAIQYTETNIESLTMVGDWFLAESVSFKKEDGFTSTFFTRNATEINKRIKDFDDELYYLLNKRGWKAEKSREMAIEKLNQIKTAIEDFVKIESSSNLLSSEILKSILEIIKP